MYCLSPGAPLARKGEFTRRRDRSVRQGQSEGPPDGLAAQEVKAATGRVTRGSEVMRRHLTGGMGGALPTKCGGVEPASIRPEMRQQFDRARTCDDWLFADLEFSCTVNYERV